MQRDWDGHTSANSERMRPTISETLHSVVDILEDKWLAMARVYYAQRVARSPGYVFTRFYAAPHGKHWMKHLGSLAGKPNLRFLEVGSFEGGSAVWFLENILTHPTSTITCIDPFLRAGSEALFDHNTRIAASDSKVTKIKGRSEAVMAELEADAYDAIYIDGAHFAQNVLMDAAAGWRLLKPGGIMIFDDYQWRRDLPAPRRPQMAIDLFLDVLNPPHIVLHKEYQVIIRKSSPSRAS